MGLGALCRLPQTMPGWAPLLTMAALGVGGGKSCKSRLAQVTALPLHVLLANALPGHLVTGNPRHCPIRVTLTGCETKAATAVGIKNKSTKLRADGRNQTVWFKSLFNYLLAYNLTP